MTVMERIPAIEHLTQSADMERAIWYNTLEAREAAKVAYQLYESGVYNPIDAVLEEITIRPELYFDVRTEFGSTRRYQLWANDLNKYDNHPSHAVREKAAELRASWMRYLAARKHIGWDDASEELERLCGEQCDREDELITLPAPDLAALRWKLEHLFGTDSREPGDFSPSYCPSFMDAILADASRLLAS